MPIIGIPCLVLAVVALIGACLTHNQRTRLVLGIVSAALLALPNITVAPANHAVLVTSSDDIVGVERSGLVTILPWQERHNFPTGPRSIHVTSAMYNPMYQTHRTLDCVIVQSPGVDTCAKAELRWSIRDDADLDGRLAAYWREYGSAEELEEQIIEPAAEEAVQWAIGRKPPHVVHDPKFTEAFVWDIEGRLRHKLEPHGIVVNGLTLSNPPPSQSTVPGLPGVSDLLPTGWFSGWVS